jgi:uncharacterized protein involved in exopolysaccharide biosynthesis
VAENPPSIYEDEIDLRELALKLWHRRIIILAVTLSFALIAGLNSFAAPRKYQATAIVRLSQPQLYIGSNTDLTGSQLRLNLSSNVVQSVYSTIPPTAGDIVKLATSDDLLTSVLTSSKISRQFSQVPLAALRSQITAAKIGDTLVQLQATQDTPEAAATLTNAWATALTAKLNESFGISEDIVKLVKTQLTEAQQALDQAEENLDEELKHNQSASLGVHLEEEKQALAAYLQKKNDLNLLARDIQRLQDLLGKTTPSAPLPFDQALTILSLEQRAVVVGNTNVPQLQVSGSEIFGDGYTVGAAQAMLDDFSTSLKQEQSALDADVAQLQSQILVTQTTLEQENSALNKAIQARDESKARILALSIQLQQMQLYSQSAPMAKVTSTAVPPQKAVSRGELTNVVMGGIMGLILSVFGILIWDWWRGGNSEGQLA